MERTHKLYPVRSGIAAVGAVCTAGLAIAALAGQVPVILAAIATIVLGLVLIFEGRAFAARTPDRLPSPEAASRWQLFQGTTVTESVTGITGTMLGVLALLSVAPMTLIPIALIVFGIGMLMEGGAMGLIPRWRLAEEGKESEEYVPSMSLRASSVGIDMIAGVVGIGLGILALIGLAPVTLVLVSLFVLGFTLTVNAMVLNREFPVYSHSEAHSFTDR